MASVRVSVAELSKNVSEYLKLANSGTIVEITSHGNVMAEINKPESNNLGVVFVQTGNTERLIENEKRLKKVNGSSLFEQLMKERNEDYSE